MRSDTSKYKILAVDDEKRMVRFIQLNLEQDGFQVITAYNGTEALEQVRTKLPDLILLDIMMPDINGFDVLRKIREVNTVPVIMLTAKGEEFDKLRGFNLGVDDYVTKPFSFAELVARVGAVLSRAGVRAAPSSQVTSGDLTIDLDQHRVTLADQVVDLTPTECRLLETLARHANRTLSTEQLLDAVWGQQYAGELKHVKHYIWTLRNKIEADPGDPKHILTERGFGYRFE